MSDDSTKQEFLTELESTLESDEAYGSNIQILTYSVKNEVINGKFKDSWNNRIYEFIIDKQGISYKPAVKLDSFAEDELPARFDSYSKGYGSLFSDVRLDRNPMGKRTKKPKPPKLQKNPNSNLVIHEINKDQINSWNKRAEEYHKNIKKLFPNYSPGNYKKEVPRMKDDPWADFADALNSRIKGGAKPCQDVLKVSDKADKKQVTKQYRELAREFHPDTTKMADKKKAAEKFMEIQNAYEQYMAQKGGRRDSIFIPGRIPTFMQILNHCDSILYFNC